MPIQNDPLRIFYSHWLQSAFLDNAPCPCIGNFRPLYLIRSSHPALEGNPYAVDLQKSNCRKHLQLNKSIASFYAKLTNCCRMCTGGARRAENSRARRVPCTGFRSSFLSASVNRFPHEQICRRPEGTKYLKRFSIAVNCRSLS